MSTLPVHKPSCDLCQDHKGRGFSRPFTMAFQPIYDLEQQTIYAHEALVRPPQDGSAWDVLQHVTDENRYSFDQRCRKTAIRLAAKLGMTTRLSINFMPNAVYEPAHCIRATLWAAEHYGFPVEKLIFEFTEVEPVKDANHVRNVISSYRNMGFSTAIDDFGAGYAGLAMLCDTPADTVKVDRALVQGIDTDHRRQTILRSILEMLNAMGTRCVVEGVETKAELDCIVALGARFIQGFVIARPRFEALVTEGEIHTALGALADPA